MKTTFPEDLSVLSLDDLNALSAAALEEFDSIYTEDFASIPDDGVVTLSALTDGLNAVKAELATREARTATLANAASTRGEFAKVTGTFEGETDDDAEEAAEVTAGGGAEGAAMSSGTETEDSQPVAYATGEGLGVGVDAPLDWDGVGRALNRRLEGFNVTPYQQAAKRGRPLKTVQSFARFTKSIPADQMIREGDSRGAVRRAIDNARDQARLNGGSLIASGGWGAPSQISYDRFPKLSSRDGIATFPEVGVEHGGLQLPTGSTFASVYASTDFISFSEQDDIDGDYDPGSGGNLDETNIAGTKPVYRLPQTQWVDHRLRVDGIHIQAGILENRGYPEGVAAEVAQVLDAHAHIINAKVLAKAAAGSTAVTMTAGQLGTTAPLLSALELQVLHYRDTHRMSFNSPLEAKIPNWIKGAMRADLSKRLGVDLLDVTDARLEGFFRDRGVSIEWVYDWQSIATTAVASFTAWPTTVSFLLYAAGTWVKGVSDVISLDTMYDSTLLGTNDFTVMFTEEGWFLAKAGPDSRLITTSISSTGATHIGAVIANSGAAA